MKKIVTFLMIIGIMQLKTYGQSVLTSINYMNDPQGYLSQLDQSKIQSGILIDRDFSNSLFLNVNGFDKVTEVNCSDWTNMYSILRNTSYDTLYFLNMKTVKNIFNSYYLDKKSYAIAFMDYKFNKITQAAIDNSDFVEIGGYLKDNHSSVNSYSNNRIVSATCGEHNISGDNMRFIVPEELIFGNNSDQKINKIEIDFGDNLGYKTVVVNQPVEVSYGSFSGYVHVKVKVTLEDYLTGQLQTLFSLFTFFKTGSSTVPQLQASNVSANKTTPYDPNSGMLYYPLGGSIHNVYKTVQVKECIKRCLGPFNTGCFIDCRMKEKQVYDYSEMINTDLEYCILLSFQNTVSGGKLRRPIIVVDGFDPGNKRDYYRYRSNPDDESLPNDKDYRGLFQLMNGDPSPWYNGDPDVYLINALRNDGYDIVFVNFIYGAGDIPYNANAFRGFLNNVINSTAYRDNKTEEIVVIGPSMGGTITRQAIASMEQANESHFVKLWIPFDSPQKGAYISYGLQHAVNFLKDINDANQDLKKAKATFQGAVDKLNSPAAKQLLLNHFSTIPHAPEFDAFYNALDQIGFPKYSKNYAISNGGKTKLYESPQMVLDFKAKFVNWMWVKGWGNENIDGMFQVFQGSRQGFDQTLSFSGLTGYDNAPGGWNSALYSFNCDKNNKYAKSPSDIPMTRTTFITTSSAFGMPVTRENVYRTWESYTGCSDNTSGKIKTPFDYVYGMETNEEHVRITGSTANYFTNGILRKEFDNLVKPVVRQGQTISQPVNGKVAYVAKQTVTLGGNGNSLIISSTSDAIAVASTSIRLLPGFETKQGSNFNAYISTVDYGATVLKRAGNLVTTKSVDYTKSSSLKGLISDYSVISNTEKPKQVGVLNTIKFFPNPVKNVLHYEITGQSSELLKIEIIDYTGKIIISKIVNTNEAGDIDVTSLSNGAYILKAINGSMTEVQKFVKE